MVKLGRMLLAAGALAVAVPGTARADGFKSYRVCGGLSFTTCAAVQITVSGNSVTVNVWNLSGNTAASYGTASNAGTVFTGIGFYNLPAGVDAVGGSLAMSGTPRGSNTPQKWTVSNNTRVDFFVDIAGNAAKGGGNGIASGCASASQLSGLAGKQLWDSPCSSSLNPAGWTTFTFQITGGSWDPSKTDVVIRGIDGANGHQVECWTGTNPTNGNPATCTTVTPEPVSMTLLATGLAGMGGVGMFRRRKKNQDAA